LYARKGVQFDCPEGAIFFAVPFREKTYAVMRAET
jgi:hypothetical protein